MRGDATHSARVAWRLACWLAGLAVVAVGCAEVRVRDDDVGREPPDATAALDGSDAAPMAFDAPWVFDVPPPAFDAASPGDALDAARPPFDAVAPRDVLADARGDAGASADGGLCVGVDGLSCLGVGPPGSSTPANLACTPVEPGPGLASLRTLRVVSVGTSTVPLPGAVFHIWPGNAVTAATCTAPACALLTSGADATATTVLDDGFFAYDVPQNASAMTYRTLGYARTATSAAASDVVAVPAALYMTALGLVRPGFTTDPADGILLGTVSDCDGAMLRGVTVRVFRADGSVIDMSDPGPLAPGLAYRRDAILPAFGLTTTDHSGSFAAANLPVVGSGRLAVVAYGTIDGGARDVIACEDVSIAPNAVTIVAMGPYRSDYPAGNLCLVHAPTP